MNLTYAIYDGDDLHNNPGRPCDHVSQPVHCVDSDNAAHRVQRKLARAGVVEGA
jgi:hypothetical protein